MSPSFCLCGAGWFRKQWEGATGKPVTIEIRKSVLAGDDECTFAITLSDELQVSDERRRLAGHGRS